MSGLIDTIFDISSFCNNIENSIPNISNVEDQIIQNNDIIT